MVAHGGCLPQALIACSWAAFGEHIVNKHYPVANKTIAANGNKLANKRVALHAAAIAHGNTFLYFRKRANKAIVANATAINIAGVHYGYVFAKYNIRRHRHRKLFIRMHRPNEWLCMQFNRFFFDTGAALAFEVFFCKILKNGNITLFLQPFWGISSVG